MAGRAISWFVLHSFIQSYLLNHEPKPINSISRTSQTTYHRQKAIRRLVIIITYQPNTQEGPYLFTARLKDMNPREFTAPRSSQHSSSYKTFTRASDIPCSRQPFDLPAIELLHANELLYHKREGRQTTRKGSSYQSSRH